MPAELFAIYAGYGDALLLRVAENDYWLIDGGPITSSPTSTTQVDGTPDLQNFNPYYQFLRNTLLRFCSSDSGQQFQVVDKLRGIIVTHPDGDHMQGVIQLIADWLPAEGEPPDADHPLLFYGPVILNDLFFEDPNKNLVDLLESKGFVGGHTRGGPPAEMTNWTSVGNGPRTMEIPLAVSDAIFSVDNSKKNASSIITVWLPQNEPGIVTTGDAIGAHVADLVGEIPHGPNGMPCLGVFKVPHHGSARNSLLDKNLLTTKADDNWNELHYFLTVLLCSNRELFRELPEGVQGEGLDLLDDVFVDAIAEWIGLSKGFRDRDRFCIILDDLGSILVKYFEVTKTVIQEGNTIYSLHDANRAANLLWLTTFLVTRHRNMQRACYSKNAKLEDLRNVANVIKKLLPKFTRQDFETFALNNLPKILPPQGVHTRARAQGYISPEYGEMIECLFSAEPYGIICAQVSIFNFYHRFHANNYVISANGTHGHPSPYVVSALIAAAIVRAPLPNLPDGIPASRLFVTDGASLKIGHIKKGVQRLLTPFLGHSIPSTEWGVGIQVFYLETDYVLRVPVDHSDVPGCTLVDFEESKEPYRQVLSDQFNQAGGYDVPMNSQLTRSTFKISIVDEDRQHVAWIGLGDDGDFHVANEPTEFLLQEVPREPDFYLAMFRGTYYANGRYTLWTIKDHNTVYLNQTISLKTSGKTSGQLGTVFYLRDEEGGPSVFCYNSTGQCGFIQHDKTQDHEAIVKFERVSFLSDELPHDGPNDGMVVEADFSGIEADQPSDSLLVTNNVFPVMSEASSHFLDAEVADTPFKAFLALTAISEIIPSSSVHLNAIELDMQETPLPARPAVGLQKANVSDSTLEQSFEDWWAAQGTGSKPEISLADVAREVLGTTYAATSFSRIPGQPFAFAAAESFKINRTTSPPVNIQSGGDVVVTIVLILPSNISLSDTFGLGPGAVSSLNAIISSGSHSIRLEARVTIPKDLIFNFSFNAAGESDLGAFLNAVGYSGNLEKLSLVAVAGSIAGRTALFEFFDSLSPALFFSIKVPTWMIDLEKTKVAFDYIPSGAFVREAHLVARIPSDLQSLSLGPFKFSIIGTWLKFRRSQLGSQELSSEMDLELEVDALKLKLTFHLVASKVESKPILLDFRLSSRISFENLMAVIGIPSSKGVLENFSLENLSITPALELRDVGFTMTQPCQDSSALNLRSVYFKVDINLWQKWIELLPQSMRPTSSIEACLTVEIIRPQAATTTYTFRVEFDITISNDYAPLHLGLSYEFSKAEDKRTSTAMCVQLSTKTAPNIPAPPIGAFLETFTQSTWENVAKAIPVLKEVANAIYVTRASLEVTRPVQGSASVSAFAISAGLSNLVLLDKPSLIVECGELDFAYFRNSWTARIKTSMLFGGKYKCSATLTLPTADEAGGFEFINNDESFTAGALVSALDLGLDLKDVPVIGSAIADVRFKYLSLSVHNVDGKLQLSGFTLQLGWDDHKIDDLVLSGSRLTIDWKRETFQSVKCISAPSSLPAFVNWSVQWEGMITDDWRLSASVQSFVPTQAVREGSEPTRQTILSGTIFNIHTSKPADSLTNLIGSSDGQPASIWNNTELCQHFKPHFTLERCMIHLSVGLETMYAVGARARWGLEASGSALLILKKVEQAGSKTWGFAFAVAVHQFRFAEFCSDSWLSQFFDGNLVLKEASAIVFRNPGGSLFPDVKGLLVQAGKSRMLDRRTDDPFDPFGSVPKEAILPDSYDAGLAIFAQLDFDKAPDSSLVNNLNTITNSALTEHSITISGFFGRAKGDGVKTLITFEADAPVLHLFSSVRIEASLYFKSELLEASGKDPVRTSQFALEGDLVVRVSEEQSWTLHGKLEIDNEKAILGATLDKTEYLSQTLGLELSKFKLDATYRFSSGELQGPDDAPNKGIVKHKTRSAKYEATLSCVISLAGVTATAYVVFAEDGLALFGAYIPLIDLSKIIQGLFGQSSILEELFNISFSDIVLYYAWANGSGEIPGVRRPRTGAFVAGFHAEADADVYGINFQMGIDIESDTPEEKGVVIRAQKHSAVKLAFLVLHKEGVVEAGPTLSMSTRAKDKGCSINAGITLFATVVGSLGLTYDKGNEKFTGTLTVEMKEDLPFLPEKTRIGFELVKKGDKHVFRPIGIPTIFQDVLGSAELIKEIRKLSEGNKCGALDMLFKSVIHSKFYVTVEFADDQPGMSPDSEGEGTVAKIRIKLIGHYVLSMMDEDIVKVDFTCPTDDIAIPKDMKSFGTAIFDFLQNAAESLVRALYENRDKFALLLGAVLFEKATPQLVGRLICREYYKPKELENDPPSEDQQPSSDDEYGPDGDFPKLNLPGFGPGWAGGTWLASAALEAAANFVPGVAVVFILVTLFGVAVAVSTILPPTFPGPPIPPHDPEDPYAKYIYDAINKDFERWRFHEDYPDARKTALDCALDYRDAIALLRKALNSPLVVKHIGKMLYKDYRLRLAYLLHGFSNLSREFGEKWLDMSKINVALSFIEGDTKLQVMWDPLYLDEDTAYAVSITVNGHEIEKDAACLDTTYIIDGSAFAGSGSRIVASVTAVTAVQGGDPPYAFFSQGAVAKGTYNQPFISVHHLDLAYAPKFPDGLEAVCHENGQAVRDSKSYPVLKIGSSTFWPLGFVDGHNSLAIVGYDSFGRPYGKVEKMGTKIISEITLSGSREVKFTGQDGEHALCTIRELMHLPHF